MFEYLELTRLKSHHMFLHLNMVKSAFRSIYEISYLLDHVYYTTHFKLRARFLILQAYIINIFMLVFASFIL